MSELFYLIFEATVSFEIRYEIPEGSSCAGSSYATTDILQDERQTLIDIEENIANLERTLANREAKNHQSSSSALGGVTVSAGTSEKSLSKFKCSANRVAARFAGRGKMKSASVDVTSGETK